MDYDFFIRIFNKKYSSFALVDNDIYFFYYLAKDKSILGFKLSEAMKSNIVSSMEMKYDFIYLPKKIEIIMNYLEA